MDIRRLIALTCGAASVALSLVFAAVPAAAQQAGEAQPIGDAEAGAAVFRKCATCHQVGPEARHRVGPHLNGVFGRHAAAFDDFNYSKALRRAGADGLVWQIDKLDAYIENPKNLVTGTRMSFRGIASRKDRYDLMAFLRQYSDKPRDIPEASPTAIAPEVVLPPGILALVGDTEYGEYLSTECRTCHQKDGSNDGIPAIVGWPNEDFVVAMHAYKRKLRPHPVMQMMAGRLTDEEIAALAAYFGAL